MRTIIVEPYNENWPNAFQRISGEIWPHIEDCALRIEHVGSTSVPGLSAKPIIDIDIVIQRGMLPVIVQRLAALGYHHEGNLGMPDREAFNYDDKPHMMAHNLYACTEDCAELLRHIIFRDYLRTHPKDRKRYGDIKIEMAKRHPHDIDSYILGKEPVVMDIYRKCGIPPWK